MRRRFDWEEEKEVFSPWETYSDLYCGLLLVFVLLFFFSIYQYIDARERNDADTAALQQEMKEEQNSVLAIYKLDLEEQQKEYDEKNRELENQQTALAIVRADLDERTDQLEEQQSLIDEQKITMGTQQEKLEQSQLLVENQKAQLQEQESELQQQRELLASQQTQLEYQQGQLENQAQQIEKIVGVQARLINELNQALKENNIQIQADKTTGAIIFESSILFPTDGNVLSEDGKSFFQKFMPVYMNVLLQSQFQDYISEIIVEGHTDHAGAYLHNLELSQQRAWSVAEYFLGDESRILSDETKERLKALITVNGCADRSPVYNSDGTVNEDKSRRVEIKFRLKDQEMIQELDRILNKQESEEG